MCLALTACGTNAVDPTTAAEADVRPTVASVVTSPEPKERPSMMEAQNTNAGTPASTSLPPATIGPAGGADDEAGGDCARVDDFDADPSAWSVVNDGVMGGRSNGNVAIADSTMRFTGTIVTAGGGFTSVRLTLTGGELMGSDRIQMRVRADERRYGLILDDEHRINGRNVSYRADLDTSGDPGVDGWQVVSVAYDDLIPTIFGQVVDAPAFVADEATEIGIIIADGLDGDFVLDVDWVDACPGA